MLLELTSPQEEKTEEKPKEKVSKGEKLNEGSKIVVAAVGNVKRDLLNTVPNIKLSNNFSNPLMASEGNLVVEGGGDILELISFLSPSCAS